MAVVGFTKFERLFRVAGSVDVDRDDVRRYLDFVNDAVYDMLIMAQATAKANVRDVIDPWDLPLTKGVQESMHAFERIDEDMRISPILEAVTSVCARDVSLCVDTQVLLPLIFGGISVALASMFRLIDPELKLVHTEEWDRAFRLFRVLV
jgi:hypothetical protein